MGEKDCRRIAVAAVKRYYNQHGKKISEDDIYVVWMCKILQNNKALLNTSAFEDGLYFEVTYNGDKQEVYTDAYSKIMNVESLVSVFE